MEDKKVDFDYSQFGFMTINKGIHKDINRDHFISTSYKHNLWELRLPMINPKIDNLGFYYQSFEQLKKDNREEEYFQEKLRGAGWLSFEYKTGMGLIGQTPTIKDLLYCLLSDYSGDTFNEWCNNFGYDNDSIKALKLYNECQDNYNKLCQCIPLNFHEAIREDLQDY